MKTILCALLVLLPIAAAAQPKQCRSISNDLTSCQIDLARYKPITMASVKGSVTLGQSLTVTLTAPFPGELYEFATSSGDWEWVELAGGNGFLVTYAPELVGTGWFVYRVLVNGQLYEYPVEIAVAP